MTGRGFEASVQCRGSCVGLCVCVEAVAAARESETRRRPTADEVVEAGEDAVLPVDGDGAEGVGGEEARDALICLVGQGDAVVDRAAQRGEGRRGRGRRSGEARASARAGEERGCAE